MFQRQRNWLIRKLGGVSKQRCDNFELACNRLFEHVAALEQEKVAQRDRIEEFILRETFGNQQFLTRRANLNRQLVTAAGLAIDEVFKEFFTGLALRKVRTDGGQVALLTKEEEHEGCKL